MSSQDNRIADALMEMAIGGKWNKIAFILPALPPSVNSLYTVIWSQRRVELKPEARNWKTEAKGCMPPWKHTPGASIRVDAHFEFPRFHKNGRYKIKDVSNLLKLLLDAVAERYGFDDSFVVAGSWSSADSPTERVTVTVTEIQHGQS